MFVAASTHPGEDEIVIEAHKAVRDTIPGLLTIIVPRHPERGAEVAALAAGMGITAARRSEGTDPSPRSEVYLADTLGELGIFYSLADAAFIGGSLARRGGQNPIEAVKLGAAVVTGPHIDNFRDVYAALENCAGSRSVTDAESLIRVITRSVTPIPSPCRPCMSGRSAAWRAWAARWSARLRRWNRTCRRRPSRGVGAEVRRRCC